MRRELQANEERMANELAHVKRLAEEREAELKLRLSQREAELAEAKATQQ